MLMAKTLRGQITLVFGRTRSEKRAEIQNLASNERTIGVEKRRKVGVENDEQDGRQERFVKGR